ncbi:MAG: hydroxymethylbilane synthase, partial [Alphaproteobacteria bacterium]|nr:hydroxymethylbilane synthase [Alphaproteobacteria bacterium]
MKLRIGTRGSPLALWQANEVRRRLLAAHSNLGEGD